MKVHFEILGTQIVNYFDNDALATYPENPNDMELAIDLFSYSYLAKNKNLPVGWVLLDKWDEFNSKAPLVFLRKPGEKYEGSATKPVFIIKDGFQTRNENVIVFEDGHVETLTKAQAQVYWDEAFRAQSK